MANSINMTQLAAIFKEAAKAEKTKKPEKIMTLEDGFMEVYWDRFRYQNKDHGRQERQMERMVKILGNPPVHEIDNESISFLKRRLSYEGLSGSTINRYLALMKTTLRWLRDNRIPDLLVPNIKLNLKAERRREFVVTEEKEALFMANTTPEMADDLLTVLLHTGTRISECLNLTYGKNIDLAAKTITVKSAYSKSGKPRTVPMSKKVYRILFKRQAESNKPFPKSYWYYLATVRTAQGKARHH